MAGGIEEALKYVGSSSAPAPLLLLPVEDLISHLHKCREAKDSSLAHHLHTHICSLGLEAHGDVGNYIVPMFVECGCLLPASTAFSKLALKNVYSWTSLMLGFVETERCHVSLRLYDQMRKERTHPSSYTLLAAVSACRGSKQVEKGHAIHVDVVLMGYETCVYVGSGLVDMYSKCGFLNEARHVHNKLVHRNLVSWNALITGYADHGAYHDVMECLEQMKSDCIPPDCVTYVSIVKACGSVYAIDKGQENHIQITKDGIEENPIIGNILVDMYARCGYLTEAQRVFDKMDYRDEISWTALISGYGEHGPFEEALICFEGLELEGIVPDATIFACILKACGSVGAIAKGKEVHMKLLEKGFETNAHISSALVDMYSKCGRLNDARGVFENSKQNVVLWNTMINGYGSNNQCTLAMEMFEMMQMKGASPDSVTFLCLLTACSRTSFVMEGGEYMQMMSDKYGVNPNGGHFMCMVDLLARSGCLCDAGKLLETLPSHPSKDMWTSFMSACKTYEDVQAGKRCFNELVQQHLQPSKSVYAIYT